jgi:hypothetical protein
MGIKYDKKFPSEARHNKSKLGFFGMKIYHLATLVPSGNPGRNVAELDYKGSVRPFCESAKMNLIEIHDIKWKKEKSFRYSEIVPISE